MKQIQQDIVQAVRNRRSFTAGNASGSGYAVREGLTGHRDKLSWNKKKFTYSLWGHEIAKGDMFTLKLEVSTCGYDTPTTVSRLNAIFAGCDIPMSVVIRKKETVFLINGQEVSPGPVRYFAGNWLVKIV